jgi:hypothetical protein
MQPDQCRDGLSSHDSMGERAALGSSPIEVAYTPTYIRAPSCRYRSPEMSHFLFSALVTGRYYWWPLLLQQ